MLRDQMINFLEAAVVLLMLTNALSIAAAVCALALMRRVPPVLARPAPHGMLMALQQWLRPGSASR